MREIVKENERKKECIRRKDGGGRGVSGGGYEDDNLWL